MSHNVKVKYYARRNTQMKPNSYYSQAIPNGTYGFDKMCEEAALNTGMEAEAIRQAVVLYSACAKRKLLDGFKVEIGKSFLTLSPSLSAKVKDEVDPKTGEVTRAAKPEDLTAVGGKSRVSCTVDQEFSHQFAAAVKWQKTDRSGNVIDDPAEDDATLDPDEQPSSGGGNSGGGSSQGGGNAGGGSSSQGGGDGDDDDVTYD